jgi:hypothetical protein
MLPTKFRFIWPIGFRGEDFLEIDQSETIIACGGHVLLTDRDEMSNLYRRPSIDDSYQIFGTFRNQVSEEKILKETRIACGGHVLLTDRDKMSNLYRGSSMDDFYQISVHLGRRFKRRIFFFRNCPIRNKNCLWRPCLLLGRDKMSNLYREPSIDASYQVSVHLAKGFQRRRLKCEKLTDNERQVMAKAHIAFGKVS